MPHVDLLELPYFEGISIDDLVSLVDLMAPKSFAGGDVIMAEGAPAPQPLFIATAGRVEISKKGRQGVDRPLAELDAPTLFGEIELFCNIPAVATAKALSAVSAFALDHPTFEGLFEKRHPATLRFIFNVARVAGHRLAIADEILADVLEGEDLVAMRQAVFTRAADWTKTTGAFRRPT